MTDVRQGTLATIKIVPICVMALGRKNACLCVCPRTIKFHTVQKNVSTLIIHLYGRLDHHH